MIILITLLLRSENPSRKRLWDGKDLTVLEKYMKRWIGKRAQRATICIALAIHRYLVSACCLRLKSANAKQRMTLKKSIHKIQ